MRGGVGVGTWVGREVVLRTQVCQERSARSRPGHCQQRQRACWHQLHIGQTWLPMASQQPPGSITAVGCAPRGQEQTVHSSAHVLDKDVCKAWLVQLRQRPRHLLRVPGIEVLAHDGQGGSLVGPHPGVEGVGGGGAVGRRRRCRGAEGRRRWAMSEAASLKRKADLRQGVPATSSYSKQETGARGMRRCGQDSLGVQGVGTGASSIQPPAVAAATAAS